MATDLFEYAEQNLARASDPETSMAAAKKIRPRVYGHKGLFVEGLLKRGGRGTAAEAAAAMVDDPNMRERIRRRQTECLRDGLVRLDGKAICSIKGTECQVYEVVR